MTEPSEPTDRFERRLTERLRAWTDAAPRRLDFGEVARELLAAESMRSPRRPGTRWAFGLASTAAAVVLAVVALSVVSLRPPPGVTTTPGPSGSAPPSSSESAVPSTTPLPSTVPGAEIDLSQIPWYTIQSIQFGTFTPPGPDDPPLPDPYELLTVGTLDGSVTTQLRLTPKVTEDGQEGAWASGPYGSDVLTGDDDGSRSRLMLVSALDGSTRTVFETDDAVPIGALDSSRETLYFALVDRETGRDRGLWRVPVGGGAAAAVYEPEIGVEPHDYASRWRMDRSVGGEYLVLQVCRPTRCGTLVHHLLTGESRFDNSSGELIGVTDTDYVVDSVAGRIAISLGDGSTRPLRHGVAGQAIVAGVPEAWFVVMEPGMSNPRAYRMEAGRIGDGPPRTLVEVDAENPTESALRHGPDAGAGVPPGWVLRWPTEGSRYSDVSVPPHVWYVGELVNVVTGERLAVPPTIWPDTPRDCEPVAPSALPSGGEPGEPVVTPGGHYLWATWASGDDQVVQAVGQWLFGLPTGEEPGPLEATAIVRGKPARVIPMGNVDGPWAIVWEENGCRYEVQLTPGGTQSEAVAYAERY
jgi:hypothetical protein